MDEEFISARFRAATAEYLFRHAAEGYVRARVALTTPADIGNPPWGGNRQGWLDYQARIERRSLSIMDGFGGDGKVRLIPVHASEVFKPRDGVSIWDARARIAVAETVADKMLLAWRTGR